MSSKYLERKITSLMPSVLAEMSEEYPIYIAGGAVTSVYTNSEINDFDVYLKNEEDIFPFMFELCSVATIISVTDKSVLVNHSGSLINVILIGAFPNPEELFKAFDFTCVMGAYDVQKDEFVLGDDFLTDNSRRVLKFNSATKFPIMSALRVKKYEERGYTISKNEFLRIMLTAMTLELKTYADVGAQIGGMYGLDIDKLVDTSKEFSLETIVDELSRVYLNYDMVANRVSDSEDTKRKMLEELIIQSVAKDNKQLAKCTLGDRDFLLIDRKLFKMPRYLKESDLPVITEGIRVYKVIDKKEGKYFSQHRPEFEYSLGVVEGGEKGIFTNTFEHIKTDWLDKKDAILIEMEVNVDDFLKHNWSDEFTFKKINFIKETSRKGVIKSIDVEEV